MHDLRLFLIFQKEYFKKRILGVGYKIEAFKNIIVAFLVVKRGKYSNSILNTSFLLLVGAALVGAPTIAENNPFLNSLQSTKESTYGAVVAYNPYENSLSTIISQKPRDKVENYQVASGDTIASIAKRYGVSEDTVKWANDLKTNNIRAGQTLKIPPITGVVHKVVAGENVYSIAKKYKSNAQKIVDFPFNDFADLETFALTPGQTLYVPDGIIETEQPRYLAQQQTAQVQAGVKGSSNFIWPTNGIITTYPIWYHMAVDIANNALPPVIAADTGTVTYTGFQPGGYGNHVIVDHGNGYQSLYAHLSQISVSAGQVVSQGQQVGIMGSTGRSTGPHLHFEIRSGGTLLNPLNFLK